MIRPPSLQCLAFPGDRLRVSRLLLLLLRRRRRRKSESACMGKSLVPLIGRLGAEWRRRRLVVTTVSPLEYKQYFGQMGFLIALLSNQTTHVNLKYRLAGPAGAGLARPQLLSRICNLKSHHHRECWHSTKTFFVRE